MTLATVLLVQLVFIAIGVWFAKRWVVKPPPSIAKFPRSLRIAALIIGCWIGTFVVSALIHKIGFHLSDGIACDEGAELPYQVMHDGVGDNVVNTFLGWSSGLIFWWIASLIWKQPTEGAAVQPATAVESKAEGKEKLEPASEGRSR